MSKTDQQSAAMPWEARREYRNADHPAGAGPWADEPDKVQWVDPATDLDCLIVRGPAGALCGYVGVPQDHRLFAVPYGHGYLEAVEVHGGLTFSGSCQEGKPENQGVCHVPLPGRFPGVWWFGFDCAHAGDQLPRGAVSFGPMASFFGSMGLIGDADGEDYRDLAYVRGQVESLATQLAA